MYCPECREERLTRSQVCAICGGELASRSQDELSAELAHVHYVLQDAKHWGRSLQANAASAFLLPHYQRRERLLLQALQGIVEPEPVAAPPVVVAPEPVRTEPVAEEPILDATPVQETPAFVPPELVAAPVGGEPVFEIPSRPSEAQQVVEAVSTWRSVWKPFLYESIGWFIGAFLVVAGSVYFVALGWSGMSDLVRGLTIFGLAAGYSAAFSAVGALLLRRPALSGAGRVVAMIGSAMAPFAPLALGAVASEVPAIFWGLTLLWAAAATTLLRKAAHAYDAPSTRILQAGMAATVVFVGAAPLLVQLLGAGAVWTAAWTIALVGLSLRGARGSDTSTRTAEQAAYAFLAPAYLGLVAMVRLHGALRSSGLEVSLATYAPFVSALLWLGLRAWPRKETLNAAAGVAAISGQLALLVASGFGRPPAFFAASAVLVWTSVWLSRHAKGATRWVYGAYAAGYLAYQSVGQLVPGWLQELLVTVRSALGYAPGATLPFNYAAVYAIPYVAVGAFLAIRWSRREDERSRQLGEVLFRCTAGATVFFAAEGAFGSDLRPAAWTVPVLSTLALGLGVAVRRPYLSWAGWIASLVIPVAFARVFGTEVATVSAGVLSLGLGVLAFREESGDKFGLGAVLHSLGAAVLVFVHAEGAEISWPIALGIALAAAGVWLAQQVLSSRLVESWALVLTLALAPVIALTFGESWPALALAVAAVAVAFIPVRSAPYLAVLGALVSIAWQFDFQWSVHSNGMGVVLLAGALTAAVAARRVPWLGTLGAPMFAVALFPRAELRLGGPMTAAIWPWLSPALFSVAMAVTAAAASAITSWRRRTPSTVAYASVAVAALTLNGLLFAISSAHVGPVLLIGAVGVALASRALRAELCLPLAVVLALSHFGVAGHVERLVLAALLTALTLLDRAPRWRDRLLGGAGATRTAGGMAAGVLGVALFAQPGGSLDWVLLAALTVLPLVALWATRVPVFSAVPAVLGAVATVTLTVGAWAVVVPILASVTLTHLVARTKLGEESWRGALFRSVQLGLVGATALVVLCALQGLDLILLYRPLIPLASPAWVLTALSVGALLCAGTPLSQRMLLASGAIAVAPGLRGFGALGIAAVGFASMHAGRWVAAVLAAPEERETASYAGVLATVLSCVALLDAPTWGGWVLAPAVALSLAALLLADVRIFALASVALGLASFGDAWLRTPWDRPVVLLASALLAAAVSALCRVPAVAPAVERGLQRLSPGISLEGSQTGWVAAALQLSFWITGVLVGLWTGPAGATSVLAVAVAALLWAAPSRNNVAVSSLLWTVTLALVLPEGLSGVAIAASGVLLAAFGWKRASADHHHAGWALASAALLLSGGITHAMFPVVVALWLASVWIAVARTPAAEWCGWVASLIAAHLFVFRLGAIFSTGQGEEFILPYLAVATALVAVCCTLAPASRLRRSVLQVAAVLSFAELAFALGAIHGVATREAFAGVAAMLLLFGALVFAARRDDDEVPAFLAQAALLLGYLSVRFHGLGGELESRDGLVALVTGTIFSGLHVWIRRHAETHRAFRRPALTAAYVFPLLGLLAAPWEEPLIAAALLVGHAAHFSVLAGTGARRTASLLAAGAFNLALYFVWQGTHAGQAEYYVIPFGLSLLVLSRVFEAELDEEWRARLRAVAITTVYSASAWRALLFSDGLALGICALICVLGVAAGIALRIRSFVYLGTGFLVTAVTANLVRTGLSQPHLGALFLSVLGVLVVGFMVLFTAQRAELVRRYERMRALMNDWSG